MPYKDAKERAEYHRKWRQKNAGRWKEIAKKSRQKHRKRRSRDSSEWAKRNPDKAQAAVDRYRAANRDLIRARGKRWYAANAEKGRAASRRWTENNPHQNRAKAAEYRARRIKATPCWLNDKQRVEILAFYEEAISLTRENGVCYEVDHIIPIRSADVCGLHVPWNLQILTRAENASKGNKFNSDTH